MISVVYSQAEWPNGAGGCNGMYKWDGDRTADSCFAQSKVPWRPWITMKVCVLTLEMCNIV